MGWRYQVPLLLKLGLRVICPDCMGYGQSVCSSVLSLESVLINKGFPHGIYRPIYPEVSVSGLLQPSKTTRLREHYSWRS